MNESLDILKNLVFFTLFSSMLIFWTECIFFTPWTQVSMINSIRKTEIPQNVDSGSLPVVNQNRYSEKDQDATFLQRKSLSFGETFFFLSLILLTIELLLRWFLSKHFPLSNLYESLVFLNWSMLTFFLIFENFGKNLTKSDAFNSDKTSFISSGSESQILGANFSKRSRTFFGAILSSVVLFLQSFADWQLPDDMRLLRPLIPALQSNWLLMHVSIMIFSYAALFIGCLLSIVYLVLDLMNDSTFMDFSTKQAMQNLFQSFSQELDAKSSQILALGFPLLTLGILSGAIWANEAWGSYWSWDPKETWAFITWLIFAFYLHTRLQRGWRGKYSARVASFGFFIVWICYLGVNLLGKGLHSYGWIAQT